MVRIEGVLLPNNKRIEYGLMSLFGIGLHRSQAILLNTKISSDVRVKDLTHEQVAKIQKYIVSNYKIEGELRKEVMFNIKRLGEIGCYRGLRHKRALPVRGQRTKTNARTRKGPRKAGGAIALKKIAAKK
jgi:small subunit ribosomal protein S13